MRAPTEVSSTLDPPPAEHQHHLWHGKIPEGTLTFFVDKRLRLAHNHPVDIHFHIDDGSTWIAGSLHYKKLEDFYPMQAVSEVVREFAEYNLRVRDSDGHTFTTGH